MELQKLRHLNQDLLRKLKANQEEFKRRLPTALASPLAPRERAAPEHKQVSDAENQGPQRFCKEGDKATLTLPVGTNSQVARLGLGFPGQPAGTPSEQQGKDRVQPSAPRGAVVRSSEVAEPASRCNERVPEDGSGSPRTFPPGCTEVQKPAEEGQEESRPLEKAAPVPAPAKARGGTAPLVQMPKPPKSILLTPAGKQSRERKKKDAGRVKFVPDAEEHVISGDSWSARPFLGYDWIAGLLETDSSLSEKPDEYFDELQDFRQVNRDACIYDQDLQLEDANSSALDQEAGADAASHQCVYCYRLNNRLFTVPTDPESACPICKTPRAAKPPETLVEPAFVRISVPRATLLPAYKHKIHRRKSYELEDNLALPSVSFWVIKVSPLPGETDLHWNSWQPWVCMCDLHKQARIRHFVVWAGNVSLAQKVAEFWQEKACSPEDCELCSPEDCPGDRAPLGIFSPFGSLPPPHPHEVKIPLPPQLDFPSYDSLPVVDDDGEG